MTTTNYDLFDTPPLWRLDYKSELLSPKNLESSPDVTLQEVIEKSSSFPRKFPIETVRCQQLHKLKIPDDILEKNINSAYPVIHEHALHLCAMFLTHQKKFGNRQFYQDMSLLELIDRFLSKRAVYFLGTDDHYMLMDGTTGDNGWESVGTADEVPPLTIQNCLSYDEMKLSAFLSVSSHTVFVNGGWRDNCGVFEKDRTRVEEDGVIMGLIGTRLTKEYVMEHREVVKSPDQNTHRYGYGRFFVPTLQGMFLNFYGDSCLTYEESLSTMKNCNRYISDFCDGIYFDTLVYARRISLSIDTLLIEANHRAKNINKMAYVHVVGLGLGVWRIYEGQDKIFMDTFAKRLDLLSGVLTNISDICFAYIEHKMAGDYKHGDKLGNVKLHMFDKTSPHTKLTGEDAGKLLVVSFAWDSNALPGNEFWEGVLDSSSDPAAACSTQVAELHNWHINKKVNAGNLRVATLKGLVTFREYQQMHRNDEL